MKTALAAAALLLGVARPAAANPDMSADFTNMMQWLSHGMAQGLAFNAGSTFDPPHEVLDKRLQPDLSFGVGSVPMQKSAFPAIQTPALADFHPENIFPSSVLFPNLTVHLRAGLPWRSDIAIRAADMTTPPGYKISSTTTGKGQSNSVGVSLRKHVLGGDELPLVTFGLHVNHVFGGFQFASKMNINSFGFSADTPVDGRLAWDVTSFGVNAVVSQQMGMLTPFIGLGFNRVTGSVSARLVASPQAALIDPIIGDASSRPEENQGRVIFGGQLNRGWVGFFFNGEVKVVGIGSGKTWIVQSGISLPFHIGISMDRGESAYATSNRDAAQWSARDAPSDESYRPARRRARAASPERVRSYDKAQPDLILLQ